MSGFAAQPCWVGHRPSLGDRVMSRSFARLVLGSALWALCSGVWAQVDPGVRGGLANTGGGLQQRGIAIPHPPLIGPNPKTGATVNDNEHVSFEEGILRAGQLESTCDTCADVT